MAGAMLFLKNRRDAHKEQIEKKEARVIASIYITAQTTLASREICILSRISLCNSKRHPNAYSTEGINYQYSAEAAKAS